MFISPVLMTYMAAAVDKVPDEGEGEHERQGEAPG
jgi:hypothetical protein